MTITDGISDNVFGIDTSAQIYVTDKNNGLTVLNMGCNIKIVTEFGYSKSFQI